jgi:mono/diheme cytochrome c family protein
LRVRDTLAPASGRKLLESTLDKAPNVPGAAPSNRPEPSETPAPAPSARAREADEPERGADEPRDESKKTESTAEKPAVATEAPVEKPAPAPTGALNGRAILADKCQKCHGPSKKKGGLRVDSIAALVAGGENGPALVPGDPGRSEIIRRLRLPTSDDDHMPPKKEPQPSEAEIAALAAWVRGLSRSRAEKEPTSSTPAVSKDETAATPIPPDTPSEKASSSAPSGNAPPPASEEPAKAASEPSDDGPPDDALLRRVPSRIALYQDAVRPLLSKRCGKCHAGEKPAARLRIDDYRALVEGGLSGPGIVPGKPDESFVCQRISLPASDDDHMPPEDEPPMTADEIALVRFWVERGASPELSLPAKDVPAGALQAAADYVPPPGKESSLRADAGCAACALGSSGGSPARACGLVALVAGALLFRRRTRTRSKPGSHVQVR